MRTAFSGCVFLAMDRYSVFQGNCHWVHPYCPCRLSNEYIKKTQLHRFIRKKPGHAHTRTRTRTPTHYRNTPKTYPHPHTFTCSRTHTCPHPRTKKTTPMHPHAHARTHPHTTASPTTHPVVPVPPWKVWRRPNKCPSSCTATSPPSYRPVFLLMRLT